MPRRGQRRSARALPACAGVPLALLGAALAVVLAAGPAVALQDPAHPRATVTRGPGCAPGGLELRVQAGTAAVHVVLATTRRPQGEDAADLGAGATTVLRTGDVAWGETVDSRLLATPADGSGTPWADELDDWTLTRPTEADCRIAAGLPPVAAELPASPSAVVTDGAAGRAVGAGSPITVTARGFRPGEPVTVRVDGTGEVLAGGTAGPDGTVALRLTVPARARGATGLAVTGGSSGTATRLELEVAAQRLPPPTAGGGTPVLPPLVALAGLTAAGVLLVPVARRPAGRRRDGGVPGSGPAPHGARWDGAPGGARDDARRPR